GVTETGDTVFEAGEFVKLLKRIAEKERGQDIDPIFLKRHIRMSVILIARPEKVDLGHQTYLDAVNWCGVRPGARSIYVFSRGWKNVSFTKEVVSLCENKFPMLTKLHEEEFPTTFDDGTDAPGYCAIFYNRKAI
ncbi:MAG: hypothetical protein AAB968_02725, partial [Patescibacteria group bacterium]